MRPWFVLAGLLAGTADAARPKREDPVATPAAMPAAPAVAEVPFGDVVAGLDHGGLPAGLASLSSQACNACHHAAHDSWRASAHAGPGSDAWAEAARASGNPACTACHQPLLAQRAEIFAFDAGQVEAPVRAPNPGFDATLHLEGVGCAACHVRGGVIVSARAAPAASTVHPVMTSTRAWADGSGCAACHQLTWPGAAEPLYDTWGEWSRSGYAQAGVGCVACHLAGGAGALEVSHDSDADLARALTVEIKAPGLAAVRGGPALAYEVWLSNTGAGHAVPTGSPWRTLQVELLLEAAGPKGPLQVGRQDVSLGRTLAAEAPWASTSDTRLKVGERRVLPWTAALPADAPPGPWAFVVRIREVVSGVASATVEVEHRLPLDVD